MGGDGGLGQRERWAEPLGHDDSEDKGVRDTGT